MERSFDIVRIAAAAVLLLVGCSQPATDPGGKADSVQTAKVTFYLPGMNKRLKIM